MLVFLHTFMIKSTLYEQHNFFIFKIMMVLYLLFIFYILKTNIVILTSLTFLFFQAITYYSRACDWQRTDVYSYVNRAVTRVTFIVVIETIYLLISIPIMGLKILSTIVLIASPSTLNLIISLLIMN